MTGIYIPAVVLAALRQTLLWLPVYFLVFAALAAVAPNIAGQKLWRRGTGTDLIYWFVMPPCYALLHLAIAWLALWVLLGGDAKAVQDRMVDGSGWVAARPLWAQVLGMLVLTDLLQYWLHRALHSRPLWRFHAVHHSPRELDWLSAVRSHPVNYVLSFTLPGVLCVVLGVPAQTFLIIGGFNTAYAYLVHANLNWTFGPLRALFASPVFHRWHHTAGQEGLNRNFAPTFPLLDLVFGTWYMPARMPERFGIPDPVPDSFLGQLLYPFRPRMKQGTNRNQRRMESA